ncbi:MAG: hypothetical protein DBX55_03550 [Verrucomicrobia bacterium]|nr:MAG: hypothetical protein DBX55_03550 [Verrucomicrobiota bacterium]
MRKLPLNSRSNLCGGEGFLRVLSQRLFAGGNCLPESLFAAQRAHCADFFQAPRAYAAGNVLPMRFSRLIARIFALFVR